MEQTTLDNAKQFVRDLADGQDVDSVFVGARGGGRRSATGTPS